MRKHCSAIAAALLGGLILSATAGAQTVTMKIGTVDAPATHSGVGAEAFAKEVDRLSKGTMKIEVLHAGKLGSIPEQIKNVLSGAQDMHLLYPEFLVSFTDEAKILSAPYVFRDLEHLQLFMKSALFKPALDKMQSLGAIVLDKEWTWFIRDPRGLVSTRPIFTPDEMKGLKLRIWESKTAIETWRGLGANPIVVARPEMYLALKQGIIEAGPETVGIAYEQKNTEIAKYWTRTDEYFQIINPMINERKYRSLTEEQRNILHQAATTAGAAFTAEAVRGFTEKKERARFENGVTVIEPNPAPWREKGKAVLVSLEAEGVIPKGLAAKAAELK